ncbi:Hypothetical protein NTJ_03359 [Nesidiocoris tenuis]|uniref:Uncharacterized protein n=1 Tax=Nesidiocoris tenuis TaxID=355587 RepID=A0ABN7AE42_9HEMI|nr:Hypothetical protein NTJ_03359 [Nesidiocoris tenuis]
MVSVFAVGATVELKRAQLKAHGGLTNHSAVAMARRSFQTSFLSRTPNALVQVKRPTEPGGAYLASPSPPSHCPTEQWKRKGVQKKTKYVGRDRRQPSALAS